MKVSAFFALCLSLGIGWQVARATPVGGPARKLEIAEYARRYDPSLAAYLTAEPRVASRAALALGRIGDPAAAAQLERCLGAADASVRAMCAYALGLLADQNALDAEGRLARQDSSSAVRYAAADALGRIALAAPSLATHDLAGDLDAIMRSDADPVVRAHAASQLDAFAGATFAPFLARSLERTVTGEPDEDVRWHAMWALYRGFAANADASFLRDALRDRSELVRVEALRAWSRRGDAAAAVVPIAALAANDPSWRVQLQARETLRALQHRPATEHLVALPPGIHLPPLVEGPPPLPLPAVAAAGQRAPDPNPSFAAPRPAPSASLAGPLPQPSTAISVPVPQPSAAPPGPRLDRSTPSTPFAAPRPESLPLPDIASFPVTAQQMNGGFAATHPRALIRTTKGDVIVRLYPEWAPATVANFLGLGARGYYDGNRWFRIVPDFVVQTGDAHDDPDGDAGYSIPAEENPVEQRSGVIAMGLNYKDGKAIRDSAGTQYYLTLSPQLHLDRAFTVFGEVESGANVLAHLVESDRVIGVRRLEDDARATTYLETSERRTKSAFSLRSVMRR